MDEKRYIKQNMMMKRKRKKILKCMIVLVLLMLLSFITFECLSIYRVFCKESYEDNLDINLKNSSKYANLDGIKNILLLSSDAREDSDSERPDSIMILTIDSNKKEIRATSILRDSYVEIGDGYPNQKINHAYSLGGLSLMVDVIQKNYDIKIDNYAIINFECFKKIIDLVGGIDAEIKDYELEELNHYILEYGTGGSDEDLIDLPGVYLLNGKQALSYARIRKCGNGDYERAERQRFVLKELINKTLSINPLKYKDLLEKVLPYLKTNLKPADMLSIAFSIIKMKDLSVEGMQIPVDGTSDGYIVNEEKGWVLFFDKELNKKYLHSFIFDGIKSEYSGEEIDLNDDEFYGNSDYEDEDTDEVEINTITQDNNESILEDSNVSNVQGNDEITVEDSNVTIDQDNNVNIDQDSAENIVDDRNENSVQDNGEITVEDSNRSDIQDGNGAVVDDSLNND